MKDISSLTYREKILLYLDRYQDQKERKEKTESVTQKGVTNNIGISRTHVSRVLSGLKDEGLIEEEMASVKDHDRKLKTYFLTSEGSKEVEELISDLSSVSISLIESDEEKEISLDKIEKETDGKLDLLNSICLLESSEDRTIDLREHGIFEPIKMIDDAPETDEFYGREEELESMEKWIEGDKPFLSVLGQKGHGTSTLTSKFVKGLKEKHVLWITLEEKTEAILKDRIRDFLKSIDDGSDDLMDSLLKKEAVLIFDNYYKVEEDVVSFLNKLLEKIDKEDALRVIVTGREGTPVYERFYRTEQVGSGLIEELKVSPLGKEEAQKILKNEIKDEALERIMMFTKGSPLLLELLREGEEEKLTDITPWEKEQISLLMYLKTETK